ncbi:MAG TPA: hypothetical protein VGK73_11160 [Polyangiaceae bacterium]
MSEFREAIPAQGSVNVDGPDSTTFGDMGTASGSRGTLAGSAGGDPAYWYTFTRNVRDGVNLVTGAVLISVWYVVHAEPSELDADHAVWGPYDGDALDPVRWRLSVNRVGEHHFEYVLEGQEKAGGAAAPYLPVLSGDGYSRLSDQHGDGAFEIDLGNWRTLDPSRHADDSGRVRVEHYLPEDIGRRHDALPRRITASLLPEGEEFLVITSTAHEDHTGDLTVEGTVNIEGSSAAELEDVAVTSRWRATGAGRADIGLSGGDVLDSGAESVTAVECWGTDFSRVDYSDSVGHEPTEGNESDCAY